MRSFTRFVVVLALMKVIVLAPQLRAQGAGKKEEAVKVTKGEVKVEYKTFDPKNLPDPPPPLKGDEAAVCVYGFGVESNVKYGYRAPARGAGGERAVSTSVELGAVEVSVSLSIVIWLPSNATAQLKAHEEGHRAIAEHYYKDADAIARRVARQVVGRKIPIKASDIEAAARTEIEKVNKELCDKVMAEMEGPCAKAQDVYDELTDHGRKTKPTSEEGVKISIERASAKGKAEAGKGR
jgi:hypothetical protein